MKTSPAQRLLLRAAQGIREQLQEIVASRTAAIGSAASRLTAALAEIESLRRKLHLACSQSLMAAAQKLAGAIARAIRDLPYLVRNVEESVEARHQAIVPSLRSLMADLDQAGNEFAGVAYDPRDGVLTVTTDPIELEDTYLGAFEIQLRTMGIEDDKPYEAYRIVALDPHPAATRSDVTHPHVSEERLCAGDAAAPIRAALATGRICDFFLLVRGVLTTYNPGSPFVALEDWDGTSCYDCGYTVSRDDICCCQSCDQEFCESCSSYCRVCDDTTCTGCLDDCPACEERVCPSCLVPCPDCGQQICKTCLEEGQCPCHQDQEENENEQDGKTPAEAFGAAGAPAPCRMSLFVDTPGSGQSARAPLWPLRVGQAAVLP